MDKKTIVKTISDKTKPGQLGFNAFKINNIKVTTHHIISSSPVKPHHCHIIPDTSHSKPVSLFRLPKIESSKEKKPRIDLFKLNKRKKYKNDSNSSLSNNSNHQLIDLSKAFLQSDNNNETTTTTEKPKLVNKLIERHTLLIQRIFRGYSARKKLIKKRLMSTPSVGKVSKNHLFCYEKDILLSNRSIVSYVSIESNELNLSNEDDNCLDFDDDNEDEYNIDI